MAEIRQLETLRVQARLLQKNMELTDGEVSVRTALVQDEHNEYPRVEFSLKLPNHVYELVRQQCVVYAATCRTGHGLMIESLRERKRSEGIDPLLRHRDLPQLLRDFERLQQEAYLIDRFASLQRGECPEEKLLFVDFSSDTGRRSSNVNLADLGQRTALSFQYCVIYRATVQVPESLLSDRLVTRYRFHSGQVDQYGKVVWHNDSTEPDAEHPAFLGGRGVLIPWSVEREAFLAQMAESFASLDGRLKEFVHAVQDPEKLDQAIATLGSQKLLGH